MEMSSLPRILITTAAYGDGHNSAARGLESAFQGRAVVKVIDPCAEGAPEVNELLRKGYRALTTYWPMGWRAVYRAVERRDFRKDTFAAMRKPEFVLEERVAEFQPDAIISTYPLYPYFVERMRKRGGWKGPLFTTVTDSIEINNAWLQAPTDYWLVTDNLTRRFMIQQGMEREKVVATGFPVSLIFQTLSPLTAGASLEPFRVVHFSTARRPHLPFVAEPVLKHESTRLTLVLGRNEKRLSKAARKLSERFPGRIDIVGWTDRVPQLLCEHHLAIGKAGGATVHECLAASIPMLIHHLVPGQEEGNLALLRHFGGGDLADTHASLNEKMELLLASEGQEWKRWKRNLSKHSRPCSAQTAAQFVFEVLGSGKISQPL